MENNMSNPYHGNMMGNMPNEEMMPQMMGPNNMMPPSPTATMPYYGAPTYGHSYKGGFVLIVVLFILLIIVGAACL
jgi:uncharacterized protein (TIGR01732 family)